MSAACLVASGSLEYLSVMLSFLAASSAPDRILSQKVSPGVSWVTMAMVSLGVLATVPPEPASAEAEPVSDDVSVAFLPPVALHAPSVSAKPTTTATDAAAFVRILIDPFLSQN